MGMFQKSSVEAVFSHHGVEDTVETVVGPSMNVEGDFVSEGNIIVKGFVSGSVKTNKSIVIEEGAKVVANVKAADARVSGEVRGNIKIGDRLEVTTSARIVGDIQCKILIIEAGALLQGKVAMAGIQIDVPKHERRASKVKKEQGTLEDVEEAPTE